MIQESQACIDAYTSGQKEKTEREDFEGGCGEDGEGKQPLNRDEGEERVVGSELGCNVSQVGERAESSHLGDIEGEMGCSGTGEMKERDGIGGKKISGRWRL